MIIASVRYIERVCSIRNNAAVRQAGASRNPSPTIMSRNLSVEPPRVGNTLAELRQLRRRCRWTSCRGWPACPSRCCRRSSATRPIRPWRWSGAWPTRWACRWASCWTANARPCRRSPPWPGHATPSLRSPDGKCELRILGPIELAGQFEWYELTVQPGGRLESEAHEPGSREHLTVLGNGPLEVRSGSRRLDCCRPTRRRATSSTCRIRSRTRPRPWSRR